MRGWSTATAWRCRRRTRALAGLRGPACRFEAGQRGVRCEVALCQVAQVHLNQRYMTRALLNLLQNAIRYAGGNIR